VSDSIDELRDYCRGKIGATASSCSDGFDVLSGSLAGFAEFYPDESPPVALLRVSTSDLKKLTKKFARVRISDKKPRDTKGWEWTDVPADGSVSQAILIQLIDRSYQIVLAEQSEHTRYELELISRNLSAHALLAELIDHHSFERIREQIEACAKPALLLKTSQIDETALPVGRSKLGGRPDLPKGVTWPRTSDGAPLEFLAQINLAEAADVATLTDLPKSGLLSAFFAATQVFGGGEEPTDDSTRVLYHPSLDGLRRAKAPAGGFDFKPAAVEFVPILSLPDLPDMSFAPAKIGKAEMQRLRDLGFAFDTVSRYLLGNPPMHKLLGYADDHDESSTAGLQLLLQLASDFNMGWGDDGFLSFWLKPSELKKRDFSNVVINHESA
jgi:uncharacterized protein YwqG